MLKTCPIDDNGFFNFSAANIWHRTLATRAKVLIVEVSNGLPYLYGEENGVHISEVDYIIEGDHRPAPELPSAPPCDADRVVARQIASEIEDGACIQVGIGAMPNAVCSLLLDCGIRNLGVHTEMLTEGIIDLYKAGCITGSSKALNPGTSECAGHRHISGTGGQLQFVRAAYASKGGKSFICLASTYERHGIRKSRITLNLTPGSIVTTPRSDMMYVVTEFGMANLKGKSIPDRAKAMISLAHPDFRDGLEREARENGLIPRGLE